MFKLFFLLFLLVPVVEIIVLIKISTIISLFYTLILIVGTAILGAKLLHNQGLVTLSKFKTNMKQGKLPAIEIIEGILLLIAGAFLLTPGFLTDISGFIVLISPARQKIAEYFLSHHLKIQEKKMASGIIIEGKIQKESQD